MTNNNITDLFLPVHFTVANPDHFDFIVEMGKRGKHVNERDLINIVVLYRKAYILDIKKGTIIDMKEKDSGFSEDHVIMFQQIIKIINQEENDTFENGEDFFLQLGNSDDDDNGDENLI